MESSSNSTASNPSPVSVYLTITSCICSLLGSTLVILSYVFFVDLRSRPRRLLVYLSIVDLTAAAGFLWGVLENFQTTDWFCKIQSLISTYSNTSSFFWTAFIAVNLYITLTHPTALTPRRELLVELSFHLVAWLLPAAVVLPALLLGGLGADASDTSVGWCWVDIENRNYLLWMLLTGKIWEFSAYIILPVVYIFVRREMKLRQSALLSLGTDSMALQASDMQRMEMKLMLIPLIFIFLRFWSSLRFILFLFHHPFGRNDVLVTLHGIGNTFQGGANCLLFCIMTRTIRQRLWKGFVDIWCCRHPLCWYSSRSQNTFYDSLN